MIGLAMWPLRLRPNFSAHALANVGGDLTIRKGFSGMVYYNHDKEPPQNTVDGINLALPIIRNIPSFP